MNIMRNLYTSFHSGQRSIPQKLFLSGTELSRVAGELALSKLTQNNIPKPSPRVGHGVVVIPGF